MIFGFTKYFSENLNDRVTLLQKKRGCDKHILVLVAEAGAIKSATIFLFASAGDAFPQRGFEHFFSLIPDCPSFVRSFARHQIKN